jgi:hypothetical protein
MLIRIGNVLNCWYVEIIEFLTLVDLQRDAQNSYLFMYNTFMYWYICLACLALHILMTVDRAL